MRLDGNTYLAQAIIFQQHRFEAATRKWVVKRTPANALLPPRRWTQGPHGLAVQC